MAGTANAQKLFSTDKSEGIDVLDFEFAIATPGLAEIAAWSADSKKLAFPQFNSPFAPASAGPWIIDAERRTLSELAKGASAASVMAWSPDGKVFAFAPHRAEKLRFLSTSDFSEVASWTTAYPSFAQCPSVREFKFTEDSDAFWAVCRSDGKIDDTGAAIVGALKLSYPDFRVLDRITFSAPLPSRVSVLKNARFAKIRNQQYFLSLIGSSIGQDTQGTYLYRYFAAAVPLDGDHKPIAIIDFEADNESGASRSPTWFDFSENFESAIVRYGVSINDARRPELDRFFETYDVKSNTKTLAFGNQSSLHCEIRGTVVIPDGKHMVAAASCAEGGGVIVFDLQTGEAVQRRMLVATRFVFLSPDGRRVAASSGAGILFYKIKQNAQ